MLTSVLPNAHDVVLEDFVLSQRSLPLQWLFLTPYMFYTGSFVVSETYITNLLVKSTNTTF